MKEIHTFFHIISVDQPKTPDFCALRKFCEKVTPFRFYLCTKKKRKYVKSSEAFIDAR